VKDNCWSWRGWYVTYLWTPLLKAGPPIQRSWANEPEEPWRHGKGLLLRILPFLAVNVGRWAPLDPERVGSVREDAAEVEEIMTWPLS